MKLGKFSYPLPNKIYLIPTRYGILFSFCLMMILLVAITYGNNLVYLLCFILGSTVLASMVFTHFNLEGTAFLSSKISPSFVGQKSVIKYILKNEKGRTRYALGIEIRPIDHFASVMGEEKIFLEAYGEQEGVLYFINEKRGRHQINRVKIFSSFPFGLFYSWKWVTVKMEYWIYPRAINYYIHPYILSDLWNDSKSSNTLLPNGEDFSHHRNYWPGDSFSHVDWKAFARGAGLLVKEFQEGGKESYIFSWEKLMGLTSDEERLSQMVFWILMADSSTSSFAVKFPHLNTIMTYGPNNTSRCLEYCASYPNFDGNLR